VELNLETRSKIAGILKTQSDRGAYLEELEKIVAIDASAQSAQTPRTRYLAAQAALVLAQDDFDAFAAVRLVEPLEDNLSLKRDLMKTATEEFGRLVDYEVGEVTAAATFYLAEIYSHFSIALMTSERPEGLSPMEMEQYDLAIEEEAYPFEEKAIEVHESNLKLISLGVYNEWIDKSLQKLAESVPARYDKPEEASGIMSSLGTFVFETVRPAPAEPEIAITGESETVQPAQPEEAGSVTEPETAEPAQPAGPTQNEESDPGAEPETAEPIESENMDSPSGTDQAARR
jgi:hypothetical protein